MDRDLVACDRPVDALELERLRDVDGEDARVRVRRADEVDVTHPVPSYVVEEGAETLDEPPVLLAWHAPTDVALLEHHRLDGFDHGRAARTL